MKNGKIIEAGSEIDSRCLKCKAVTNHTIVAMVDGRIAKVLCNVCGAQHNYRPAEAARPASPSRQKARSSAGAAGQAKAEALFEELMAGRDPSCALAYDMAATFGKGDLLAHPLFGLGVVTERVLPDKIEVRFRQGGKLLICGRHSR